MENKTRPRTKANGNFQPIIYFFNIFLLFILSVSLSVVDRKCLHNGCNPNDSKALASCQMQPDLTTVLLIAFIPLHVDCDCVQYQAKREREKIVWERKTSSLENKLHRLYNMCVFFVASTSMKHQNNVFPSHFAIVNNLNEKL